MKYTAVIFDLFGTLAHEPSRKKSESITQETAAIFSVPISDFEKVWAETRNERGSLEIPTTETYLKFVCQKMGVVVTKAQIDQSVDIRMEWVRQLLIPREKAVETLSQLKLLGYRTGLVTNCGHEVPALWATTPLAPFIDSTVFSCQEGLRKPDIRMFQRAMERLGVNADRCLYVGDGDSGELSGALNAGMHTVMIKVLLEDPTEDPRTKVEKWTGPKIDTIQEVL